MNPSQQFATEAEYHDYLRQQAEEADRTERARLEQLQALIREAMGPLTQRIEQIGGEMQSLHQQAAPPPPPPTAAREEPSNVGAPTKHLGSLATYSGERDSLEPWLHQVEAKLAVDYVGCPETVKFFLVQNHLRDTAMKQMQPWIASVVGTGSMNVASFKAQLRQVFGDPHQKEKAQRKLRVLKQGNRRFTEFLVEFQRLLLEAGGATWPEDVKKSSLLGSISIELQRILIGRDTAPMTLVSLCDELKLMSDQLEALNQRTQFNDRFKKSATTTSGSSLSSTMDWEPTAAVKVAKTEASQAGNARAKWVSQETIAYRKSKGLCLRCGRQGHMVAACTFLPARRPLTTAVARASSPDIDPSLAMAEPDVDEPREVTGKD